MTSRIAPVSAAVFLVLAAFSCRAESPDALLRSLGGSIKVKHSQNAKVVPAFEVFEITFEHDEEYENPFFDVTISVTFASPSGRKFQVGGFHYGSSSPPTIAREMIKTPRGERQQVSYKFDKQDLWKARFAPSEVGKWKYSFVFRNAQGQKATGRSSFKCIEGRRPNRGFVRKHPTNPFRFVFDDGSPYFPIGLQDCWGDNSATGSVLDQCSMEGPFRTDRSDAPELPDGPMYVRGESNNPQNADVYFRHFSQCGFNMYRFSQQNCSYSLNRNLEKFLIQESIMTDELLQRARAYGFVVFYGIFGFQKVFNDEPFDLEKMEKVKRFIKYSVDRWGAYVDIWELLNEQKTHDRWYAITVPYLKSLDPYGHLVTTSWERPDLAGIEISAPHWYQNEDELESDKITASRANNWKRYDMPVVVGEQGNRIDRRNPVPGIGGVWDKGSARRMRIRNWTAFFNEIAFIFWNTSYARDGHYMNIWLGPKERQYVRAMQDFAYRLDKDVRMVPVKVSLPKSVRAYGLASQKRAGVYLHHFSDHENPVEGLMVTLDAPADATAYWYSPENAEIRGVFDVSAGKQTLKVPPFVVDIALLVTPDGPPDIDADGMANNDDPDDDNDGVPDADDAFELDPSEWADKDGDWIGDNMDADDDGDGVSDDDNKNGVPDCDELDLDGDGIDRAKSVPWDAFPLDPKEWRDTDADGTGDNADTDDDGDGYSDKEERKRKTSPKNKLDFPA